VHAERQAFIEEWRQKVAEELAALRRDHNDVAKPLDKARKRNALIVLTHYGRGGARDGGSLGWLGLTRAESFFTLVPLNAPLEAEVSIDAKDIGFVSADAPRGQARCLSVPKARHTGGCRPHDQRDALREG